MLIPVINFTNPSKTPLIFCIRRCISSWGLAIKNASSPREALDLYTQMHRENVPFDTFSILFTLKSCTCLQNVFTIHHLHCHAIKLGFIDHVYVATGLLNSYAVMSFVNACKLFDEMPDRNTVTWNTMVTGFSRTGNVTNARRLFDEMPERNVASWSAMITAYVNNGLSSKGLLLFREMMERGETKPDEVTVGSVLSGCTRMESLGLLLGKSVHGFMAKNAWELDVVIGTTLVDMYAKCGSLVNAIQVFDLMKENNVITWTSLICGAAQHGCSREALALFKRMQESCVTPNEMTFTGILRACAHSELVEEGREYFKLIEQYGLEVRIQHYGCMVDLFGKAGLVEEAHDVIRMMKFQPNVCIWGSLLSACKEHKRFDIAKRLIDQVLRILNPENDGGVFTLIADLYTSNEKWDDAERVRTLMANQNARKCRGTSTIQLISHQSFHFEEHNSVIRPKLDQRG